MIDSDIKICSIHGRQRVFNFICPHCFRNRIKNYNNNIRNRIIFNNFSTSPISNSLDSNRQRSNSLDSNRQRSNSLDSNRQRSNSLDSNRQRSNSLDSNRRRSNSLDSNRRRSNSLDSNRRRSNSLDSNRRRSNSLDSNRHLSRSNSDELGNYSSISQHSISSDNSPRTSIHYNSSRNRQNRILHPVVPRLQIPSNIYRNNSINSTSRIRLRGITEEDNRRIPDPRAILVRDINGRLQRSVLSNRNNIRRRISNDYRFEQNIIEVSTNSFEESMDDIQKNPVDKELLKTKTNTFYININNCNELYKNCCICITKFENQELVRILPCFHIFHITCIDKWFEFNNYCPLCKEIIS